MARVSAARLLERARQEGTPLIDGDQVTFVWQGEEAPRLIADFTNWEWGDPVQMQRQKAGVWTHTITLPPDAYIEYAYVTEDGRWRDPFNPHLITNGMGKMNHYFTMPQASHTPLVRYQPGALRGTLTQHKISGGFAIVGAQRLVYTYQPPTHDPAPLLFVLDGKDYVTRAKLVTIVDNLIAAGRIRPIALVMTQHGGQARFVEYMCSDSTLAFLLRDVLPLAQTHCNLLDVRQHPGSYGILGASMGGLMALYAGLRLPEVFGKIISQSGAFSFELMGRETIIYDLARQLTRRPIRVWMDVGRYEWLLESNRKMRGVLTAKGYDPIYREYNGGHNYTSWRDEVVYALEALYGI